MLDERRAPHPMRANGQDKQRLGSDDGSLNQKEGCVVQKMRTGICRLAVIAFLTNVAVPAHADTASDLRNFWENSGGGINVTGPLVYNGQRAGYATMGSVQVRTRVRQTNLANIQLPSVRAGCGGIDIFGGAFSFISREELIRLMEAIMQNAAGFAFELALESMSPAIQETVAKLRDLVQRVNAMNINSCEAGQLLTSALWPAMDGASQHICSTIGGYQGLFADRVASRHNCGRASGQRTSFDQVGDELREQVPIDVNYAWEGIKKNAFLSGDRALAEFFMTLTGTVITTAPDEDDEGPQHRPIAPRAGDADMVEALVEGGSVQVWRCDDTNKCLNPTMSSVTIPQSSSLLTKTEAAITSMKEAIQSNGNISDEAVALVGMTSIPVMEHLVTGMCFQHVFVQSEIAAMAQVVAVDLAMIYIDQALNEMAKSASRVSTFGDITREFQEQIRQTQNAFSARRSIAAERYSSAMRTLERLALAKRELAGHSSSTFSAMVAGQ